MIWATVALAHLIGLGLTGWLAGNRPPFRLLDQPNKRSLHDRPVPRGGGLAILAGSAVAWGWVALAEGLPVALAWAGGAALLVAVVSFADDVRTLSPWVRLAAQGGAAGVVVSQGLWPERWPLPGLESEWPVVVGAVFAWLFVVWMTNLFNFMDGMDGFAGGMTVIGFGALAGLGGLAGAQGFALLCGSVAAAAAGFLVFNFPPARIFMGDVGGATLGFLAAALILWADREGLFALWVGVLVFSPFVVDATVTLIRRILRGEAPWRAHRSHCYQRIVQRGWGHRRTVLWEYALMFACAGSALWSFRQPVDIQWWVIGTWAFAYTGLILAVDHAVRIGYQGE